VFSGLSQTRLIDVVWGVVFDWLGACPSVYFSGGFTIPEIDKPEGSHPPPSVGAFYNAAVRIRPSLKTVL